MLRNEKDKEMKIDTSEKKVVGIKAKQIQTMEVLSCVKHLSYI